MRTLILCFCLALVLQAADTRTVVDNDAVRILSANQAAHEKTPLHRHEFNRVMVYLDAGEMRITDDKGHVTEQRWKAGQTAWSAAGGMHTSENPGNTPLRMIEVELKKPAPSAPVKRNPKLDPVALDPKHNVLLFENPQVRVFRSWREPGASEPMHEHTGAGRVSVLLSDLNADVKTSDGKTMHQEAKAGDALWSPPITHSTTNLAKTELNTIIIEVK